MLYKAHSLALALGLLASAAVAENALSDIGAGLCRDLLPDPEASLAEMAPDLVSSAGFPLLVEAIQRHCGALGELVIDDTGQIDLTRSYGADGPSQEQAEKLAREARYYFETAMQVDPDASNDLLRRLLGSGPRPAE